MLIYSISNHEYGIYMSFSLALISRERNSNGWLNGIDFFHMIRQASDRPIINTPA